MPRIFVVALLALLVQTSAAVAQTRNNDNTCDIAVAPAATLLLPYFAVDLTGGTRTTLVTITNVSPLPQIARATLWTDRAYPLLTFDLFLTGYGVASFDLRELLVSGRLPAAGSDTGSRSLSANPNHLVSMPVDCGLRPTLLWGSTLRDVQSILTTGRAPGFACAPAGSPQFRFAAGYMTFDVVATCGSASPENADYYTRELLFDNVLIGDVVHVLAEPKRRTVTTGNPLVHIRAIPEGGPAGTMVESKLPHTFYDRYLGALPAKLDRRQPLPSSFAARYIEAGSTSLNSRLQIWREGVGTPGSCAGYVANSGITIGSENDDVVRFDEHENANVLGGGLVTIPPPRTSLATSAAAEISSSSSLFPSSSSPSGDVAGWLYFNLNNSLAKPPYRRASQNWITILMVDESRYAFAFDAAPLANGCSPARLPKTKVGAP